MMATLCMYSDRDGSLFAMALDAGQHVEVIGVHPDDSADDIAARVREAMQVRGVEEVSHRRVRLDVAVEDMPDVPLVDRLHFALCAMPAELLQAPAHPQLTVIPGGSSHG